MRSICLGVLLILQWSTIHGQDISVITYNIRLDIAIDGDNAWAHRKAFLASQIQFYGPDILGTQEGLPHQIGYLNDALSAYSFIGVGRDGGDKGEYCAIFYNNSAFTVKHQNTFWLSETQEHSSKGWDAAYIRICTYGLFKHKKTQKEIWVFNTHLDNKGQTARKNSIKLIQEKIKEVNSKNHPVILMGDFNVIPESDLIVGLKTQMHDAKVVSAVKPFGPEGTFNAFKFDAPVTERIDYIFVSGSGEIKVKKYAVLSDSRDLKYPSDHLPVYTELTFKKLR